MVAGAPFRASSRYRLLAAGPDFTLAHPNTEVPTAPAIQPKHDLLQTRGGSSGRSLRTDCQSVHQLGHGDVAPFQIEDLVGPVVAVQTDPAGRRR